MGRKRRGLEGDREEGWEGEAEKLPYADRWAAINSYLPRTGCGREALLHLSRVGGGENRRGVARRGVTRKGAERR